MSFVHWLLIGGGAWAIAVALKIAGDVAFHRSFEIDFHDWVTAVLSGVWSATCELGLAAIAFAVWQPGLWDAVAFALGAAGAEFLLLLPAALAGGIESDKKKKTKQPDSPLRAMTWRNFAIERVLALAGHIGSRLLFWVGVVGSGGIVAAASAFGLHALSEAGAAYGEAKEWDWLKPRIMWPFLIFQTVIVGFTIWLAIHWSGALQ